MNKLTVEYFDSGLDGSSFFGNFIIIIILSRLFMQG